MVFANRWNLRAWAWKGALVPQGGNALLLVGRSGLAGATVSVLVFVLGSAEPFDRLAGVSELGVDLRRDAVVVPAVEVELLTEFPDAVPDVGGEFELQVVGGLAHALF